MAMTTGLQGDIEHAASRTWPSLMKGENFCMGLPCLMMIGFGHDLSLIDDHCAYHGVGIRFPFSPSRQGKGTFHVSVIRVDGDHRLLEEIGDFLRDPDFNGDFFFTDVFFTMDFLAGDFFVTIFFLETSLVDLATATRFFLVAFPEER